MIGFNVEKLRSSSTVRSGSAGPKLTFIIKNKNDVNFIHPKFQIFPHSILRNLLQKLTFLIKKSFLTNTECNSTLNFNLIPSMSINVQQDAAIHSLFYP